MITRAKFIAIGGLALVSVWITYPSDKIDISLKSCKPSGALANVRSTLHADLFWKYQRQALSTKLAKERNRPKQMAKLNRSLDEVRAETDELLERTYQEYPQLRPPPPTQSERLRQLADAAEDREFYAEIETLRRQVIHKLETCLSRIQSR